MLLVVLACSAWEVDCWDIRHRLGLMDSATYLSVLFHVALAFLASKGQLVFNSLLCPQLQYFGTDRLSDNNL